MDEATKAKPAEHRLRKQSAVALLRDLTPLEMGVACDWLKEQGLVLEGVGPEPLVGRSVASLSRATPAQVEALAASLPHAPVLVAGYPEPRRVVVFQTDALLGVLAFLKVQPPRKYVRSLMRPFSRALIFDT